MEREQQVNKAVNALQPLRVEHEVVAMESQSLEVGSSCLISERPKEIPHERAVDLHRLDHSVELV